MPRTLSDIVGRLFPTTQTGSYPRPRWNSFDLGGEDIRVALRRADFAEAYADGVRAMIGDQVAAGIDVPTDGHLWYDRHEGLISSFLLYPALHLDGIEVLPEPNPNMLIAGDASVAAFGNTWSNVVVTGPVGRGTMHLDQRIGTPTVKLLVDFVAPGELGDELKIRIIPQQVGRSSCTIKALFTGAGRDRVRVEAVLVCMDLESQRAIPWPDTIRDRMERGLVKA